MEIKIYNDKKETFESFESSIEKQFSLGSSHGDCSIYAYGANERESKENLKKLAQIVLNELQRLIK